MTNQPVTEGNPYPQLADHVRQITGAPVVAIIVSDEDFTEGPHHIELMSSLTNEQLLAGMPSLLRQFAEQIEAVEAQQASAQPPLAAVADITADGIVQ